MPRVVTGLDIAMSLAAATATPSLAHIPAAAEPVLAQAVLIPPMPRATAFVPIALDPFVRASLIPPAAQPMPRIVPLEPTYRDGDEPGTLRWALPTADFSTLRLDLIAARERSPALYRSDLVSRDFGAVRTGNAKRNPRMLAGVALYAVFEEGMKPTWGLAGPVGKALVRIYDAADGGVE